MDMYDTNQQSEISETDEAIIRRVKSGDMQSYETIMRRYNQRLFRTARSILQSHEDAQDAVQEAYISAYYKLDTYVSSGKLGAWLTRIVVNEALMMKRKPDNKEREQIAGDIPGSTRDSPLEALAQHEIAVLIEQSIDALPDVFRTVFVLRAVQQLSVRETADSLDIKEATVKTRYLRARQQMQLLLDQHIAAKGMHVFEFAGSRCDAIVRNVMQRLSFGKS